MGSMEESDTAYLKDLIERLERKMKDQADLYMIERTSGKRFQCLCGVFQLLWLLACTVFITIILINQIPEIHNKVDNITDRLPVGTIMSWLPDDNPPPEGDHYS